MTPLSLRWYEDDDDCKLHFVPRNIKKNVLANLCRGECSKMSSCGSNACVETTTPSVNAIVNNAPFHSNSQINHMPPQIVHILLFSGRPAAPDFVMKCIEVRAVRWPEVWKFYGSLTLLHFRTEGSEWCTECQGWHSSRKRLRAAEAIKNDNMIS